MNIAIDISPLKTGHFLQHRVRGTGFYIENLRKSLKQYYPKNKYTFFTRGEKLPKDVDLVHYPYFEPFFLTLPFINKNKFVVTVHDLTPLVFKDKFPSGIRGKLKWEFQKMVLKKADAIIADSLSSKNDIVKFAGVSKEKIHVVYLAAGEEFERFKTNDLRFKKIREKYKLPDKFVLYVGDVTWNKNLPSLVRAVNKINVPLVLVGKALIEKDFDRNNAWNSDLVEIQELIKTSKNVFPVGFVDQEDLVLLYNIATVFAMPSFYEGFGLPILEAMSCGCPVVTSGKGSIREIAGQAAYYVDAYDINSIASGIEKVFADKKLQEELISKGLENTKRFSWKKTAFETLEVYRQVLK